MHITLKDRADPDKVGLYQLFKKPGFQDTRYRVKNRCLVRELFLESARIEFSKESPQGKH